VKECSITIVNLVAIETRGDRRTPASLLWLKEEFFRYERYKGRY